jgi:hypothetical protein
MRVYATGQRDLLPNSRASGSCKLDFGKIRLRADDTTADGRRANVDEEKLSFDQFRDLGLFLVFHLDTKQATKQEQADLDF